MATRRKRRTITTRRRRGRSQAKTLVITRQRVGWVMAGLAFLYFFGFFVADGKVPVVDFFNQHLALGFGKIGILPFFLVTGVTGVLILWRGQMMRTWFKIYFAVVILLS